MYDSDLDALRNVPRETAVREVPATIRVGRSERRDMEALGVVESESVIRHNVTIVNLSSTGCLLRSTANLAPGDSVLVTLPGIGGRRATVRRLVDGCYGCAFERPLDISELTGAFTPPEEEDVQAIRRRIRDTITVNDPEGRAEPEGRRSRIMSGLRRIIRPGQTE